MLAPGYLVPDTWPKNGVGMRQNGTGLAKFTPWQGLVYRIVKVTGIGKVYSRFTIGVQVEKPGARSELAP